MSELEGNWIEAAPKNQSAVNVMSDTHVRPITLDTVNSPVSGPERLNHASSLIRKRSRQWLEGEALGRTAYDKHCMHNNS